MVGPIYLLLSVQGYVKGLATIPSMQPMTPTQPPEPMQSMPLLRMGGSPVLSSSAEPPHGWVMALHLLAKGTRPTGRPLNLRLANAHLRD